MQPCLGTSVRSNGLIRLLKSLRLPQDDYVVCGSGPLLAHGLRQTLGDIDLVAGSRAWDQVVSMGTVSTSSLLGTPRVSLAGGRIEVFDEWFGKTAERLIERSSVAAGVRFMEIEEVISYKTSLGRPKDVPDLQAIASHVPVCDAA